MDETSTEYQAAVELFEGGDRIAGAQALVTLAASEPELRQPVADTLCEWLRTATEATSAGVLRSLAALLRDGESVSVDLTGATLTDVDFSGCRLDIDFADTSFRGTAVFDGATFEEIAAFPRAVFHGDASFAGARFEGDAEFGRVRFHGRTDFTGAVFDGMAWFGRGTDTWWEDDEAWDTVEEIVPAPWNEPNEDDPDWPVAVLMEDYQDWEEGGDGARFVGDVSFRGARFDGPAWFYYARFAGAADFGGAHFAGRFQLDQPTVDLTGARWGGDTEEGPSVWPLGWAEVDGALVPDESVLPYARQLADRDPAVRSAGLRILDQLGDGQPELRQRIVVTICGLLREPLPFDLRAGGRTGEQEALLRVRDEAQRLLARRLRPGPGQWKDMDLFLCGATLVDLDFSGCEAGYVDFSAAQFHGTTRLEGSRFDRASYTSDGPLGRATFHGDVTFAAAPPDHVVVHGTIVDHPNSP